MHGKGARVEGSGPLLILGLDPFPSGSGTSRATAREIGRPYPRTADATMPGRALHFRRVSSATSPRPKGTVDRWVGK